ncbi:hypothetical protein [Novosphingobium sp. BL-52-GroH]|uniref:hypothetical protein n=1 Tax=Novosphingobium sp. BL-52-GroH TaxID=3349877 RepID=UPI00384C4AC1
MFRIVTRIALMSLPALALAACGSSHEDDLEKQLADAKATASEEATALKAERDAASARAAESRESLEQFYAGDSAADDAEAPDEDEGPSPADAAPAPPPPPAAEPMPVGPPNPVPQ